MKSYLLCNFAICSLTKIGSYTLNNSQMRFSELRVIKKKGFAAICGISRIAKYCL